MNIVKTLAAAATVATLPLLYSCVKDEPLNAECDILSVTLPDAENVLNRAPIITNDKVELIVKNDIPLTDSLAPEFTVTPGATISPASGTPRLFLEPQIYTVTSQDGQWSKLYTVSVVKNKEINLDYDFNNVRIISALGGQAKYDEFYELNAEGQETLTWASANSAYALTLQAKTPDKFPTYQSDGGVTGKCVTLVTRSTGSFGSRVGKPIAAGNLFMGQFVGTNAIQDPLGATHFGVPFYYEPTTFSGYYKYTPGETYCEPDDSGKLQPVEGQTDMFNLYLVMFEVTTDMQYLDGRNVLSADNPNIIGTAEIPDRHASDNWVTFKVPFLYREGKSIDPFKLQAGHYSIAVVMSSSEKGDYFCGAIGSTLMVDELNIDYNPII